MRADRKTTVRTFTMPLVYLRGLFTATLLWISLGATAANIRRVTGSTLDQTESSAINLNFQGIDSELLNTVHKTSTETVHGNKYFSGPVPWADVMAFGASCNGVADDTAALQKAMDSLTSGGVFKLPDSEAFTCIVSTPGIRVRSNVMVIGKALIKASPTWDITYPNSSLITNYNTATSDTNIWLEGLRLDGNALASRAVIFINVSSYSITNCYTKDPITSGAHIDVRGSSYGNISGNFMDDHSHALGINVLDGSNYVRITNNTAKNLYDSFVSVGSGGTLCQNIVIANNDFDTTQTGYGIDLFGRVDKVAITGNIIKSPFLGGINGSPGSGNYPGDVTISNNIIWNGSSNGIALNNATTSIVSITGNQIKSCVGGVSLSQMQSVTFIGNTISTTTGSGIVVDGPTRAVISENVFDDIGSYGISINNADGYLINNNRLVKGGLCGIEATGITNSVITGNVIKNYGRSANGAHAFGIHIGNGSSVTASTYNVVANNRAYDDQGSKTQDTGFFFAGNSNLNQIFGNEGAGNGSASFSMVGSGNNLDIRGKVSATLNTTGKFFSWSDGTRAGELYLDTSNLGVGSSSNHSFQLMSNDQFQVTISTNGYLGVNQTNPTRRLEVVDSAAGPKMSWGDGTRTGYLYGDTTSLGIGSFSNHDFFIFTNYGSAQMTFKAGGGVQIGAPTGGDKGAGTLNLAGDVYKNNTAYTNPDYALELWANGKIKKFKYNNGASDYKGRLSLPDLERFMRKNYELPGVAASHGMFERQDVLLEKLEEAYIYIIELNRRIEKLETSK